MKVLRETLVMFVALTVLTGIVYPLAITLIAQSVFSHQANGSLTVRDGKAMGSELVGQAFTDPKYFWGRPAAAGYNGAASTGSNYGPTNPAQLEAVRQRVTEARAANLGSGIVPVDLVTASASGLDPHISPAAAEYQVNRVAQARSLDETVVRGLVAAHTSGRTLGVLGEPRVNVLTLNLALDRLQTP